MRRSPKRPAVLRPLLRVLLTRRAKGIQQQTELPSHHPKPTDQTAWVAYWQQRGQPWRTEPEIDESRQAYLAERRAIPPDIAHGIYPFKDIKLSRADVEWLLATHENGRGPVEWSDESQRDRVGLDLRGADVHHVNLSGLPLARLCGGFRWSPKSYETVEQLSGAAIMLESAALRETSLQAANLRGGHLQQADLRGVHLEQADLSRAHLEGANLRDAHLEGAVLIQTSLAGADLPNAHLEGARLIRAAWRAFICARPIWKELMCDEPSWTARPILMAPSSVTQRMAVSCWQISIGTTRISRC